jgi:hypothetical protein
MKGTHHINGSQGQTERAVALQEEEEDSPYQVHLLLLFFLSFVFLFLPVRFNAQQGEGSLSHSTAG